MSGMPPTDRERARAHAEALILDAYRSRIATARSIANPARRRLTLAKIYDGLTSHLWPASEHPDLREITDAARRLAEDVRVELFGPRLAPIATVRLVGGQPTIGEV